MNIHNFFIYDNISSKLFPSYHNYTYHENCLNMKRNNINLFRNKNDSLLKKKRNEIINGHNSNSGVTKNEHITRKDNHIQKYNEYRKTFHSFSSQMHNLLLSAKHLKFSNTNLLFEIQKIWRFYQKTKLDCLTQKIINRIYNDNQINHIVENYYKKILITFIIIYSSTTIFPYNKAPNQTPSKTFIRILFYIFQVTKVLEKFSIKNLIFGLNKINKNYLSFDKVIRTLQKNCLVTTHLCFENVEKSYHEIELLCQFIFNSDFYFVYPQKNLVSNFDTKMTTYIKESPKKYYTLVLDLDETLIHSVVNGNKIEKIYYRPYLFDFLKYFKLHCEIIIFSACHKEYGNYILDLIEKEIGYKVFDYKFFREHTTFVDGKYIKDLSKIGRKLDRTIIVDNLIESFEFQRDNGILINSYLPDNDDYSDEDDSLYELGIILKKIIYHNKENKDVRAHIKNLNLMLPNVSL